MSMRLIVLWSLFGFVILSGCSDDKPSSSGGDGNRSLGDMLVVEADVGPDSQVVADCDEGATRVCRIAQDGRSVACEDESTCITGTCTTGVETCNTFGLWSGVCEGAIGPIDERCDTLDNDCDGSNDETLNVNGPCEYRDMNGVKQPGTVRCDTSTLEAYCEPARDCDFDGDGDGVGQCEDCDDRDFNKTPGAEERCDGIDNNCNGTVDENFLADLGRPCENGQGQCARSGSLVCAPTGLGVVCDATPGIASDERCDELDNDCDGLTDEDFRLNEPCEVGKGVCLATGTKECNPEGNGIICLGEPGAPFNRSL